MYSPPNTSPPLIASPPIPSLIFKSRICFFLVIYYDSLYHRFPIPLFFRQSRDRQYWGGPGGSTVHSNISKVNMNLKESRTALTVYIMQCKKEENRWKERGKRKGEEILKWGQSGALTCSLTTPFSVSFQLFSSRGWICFSSDVSSAIVI